MNKLGSEFFKPIDGFERGVVGGATWRQVLMMLGIFLGAGLS
ncbi:PrgI family protein, partial [Streptococcus suis]